MAADLLLNEKQIREAADLLGEILVSYQAGVADRHVLPEVDRTAIHRLLEEPFPEEPRSVRTLFDEFREVIPSRLDSCDSPTVSGLHPLITPRAGAFRRGARRRPQSELQPANLSGGR
ncbi:MAG: hypothetical protein O7F16_12975 [Acidobacteria bacterium]|nr:hypothetical protein [Acidobacteriota bacterium]